MWMSVLDMVSSTSIIERVCVCPAVISAGLVIYHLEMNHLLAIMELL